MKRRMILSSVCLSISVMVFAACPKTYRVTWPVKAPSQDVFMLGDVKFEHKLHQQRAANKCGTCHHASRPKKPAEAAQRSCFDCHTKPPQTAMKMARQGRFQISTVQAAPCIACHKMQNAQGKKAPTKCMECHKKNS